LFRALFLKGGCGAEGGIKGYIIGFTIGRTRLNVATVFTLGVCA
jgi:hypothetical protein